MRNENNDAVPGRLVDKFQWLLQLCPGEAYLGLDIQCKVLHETPTWVCALASRLSHESFDLSTPESDTRLLNSLIKSGDEHAKSMRGKEYTLWIEAPRYFWAEMDTYRVGTEPLGSTSTMHKEARGLRGEELVRFKQQIPEGLLQARIWVFSYHTLLRIIHQRKKHKLPVWQEFCSFAERVIRDATLC
jgi:hypothetical protein